MSGIGACFNKQNALWNNCAARGISCLGGVYAANGGQHEEGAVDEGLRLGAAVVRSRRTVLHVLMSLGGVHSRTICAAIVMCMLSYRGSDLPVREMPPRHMLA